MMIGVAIDGLRAAAPGQLKLWPDAAIATGLIAVATVIVALTARVWILYIAGCLLFAIPKLLIVIMSGRSIYSPHEPFSRLQAAELGLFPLVSRFRIYRATVSDRPRVVDRLAFTFFMLALVLGLSQRDFAAFAFWQVAGVTVLWLAWFLSSRKRGARGLRRATTGPTGSGQLRKRYTCSSRANCDATICQRPSRFITTSM